MKIFLFKMFIFSLFLMSCGVSHTIYLVRHAEKSSEGKDPILSDAGVQRAKNLANLLQDKSIQDIYATNTVRTRSTAMPLSEKNKLIIQLYSNDTLFQVIQKVKNTPRNALIVGHSNTVLKMLGYFPTAPKITEIKDTDFSNLFVLKVKRCGKRWKTALKETKF